MNISFKRNDVQLYIENAQKCYDVEKWGSYKHIFLKWKIEDKDVNPLKNCRESDITSYFFKAFESFLCAIEDLHYGKQSWAIVKLYYSIFYLLRCDILLSGHLIVRNGALYYTKLKKDESFVAFNKKAKGDHQLAIELVKELKKNGELSDPILDNLIDDLDPYSWYMHHRERINYSQKNFSEPETDICFVHLESYFKDKKVIDLFKFYDSKDYSICFDTDHSILSIPFKKLKQIIDKSQGEIDLSRLNSKKVVFHLRELKSFGIKKADLLSLIKKE